MRFDPTRRHFLASAAAAGLAATLRPTPTRGQGAKTDLDPKVLQAVLDKAHDFLKTRQKEDGSFAPPQAGEPGVTALAAAALVRAGRDSSDPGVAKAMKYLEGMVKPDGGVDEEGRAHYTTARAGMAFREANDGG